jgi:hypothetical protein
MVHRFAKILYQKIHRSATCLLLENNYFLTQPKDVPIMHTSRHDGAGAQSVALDSVAFSGVSPLPLQYGLEGF